MPKTGEGHPRGRQAARHRDRVRPQEVGGGATEERRAGGQGEISFLSIQYSAVQINMVKGCMT